MGDVRRNWRGSEVHLHSLESTPEVVDLNWFLKAYRRYGKSQKGQAVEKIKPALPVSGGFKTDLGEDITEMPNI